MMTEISLLGLLSQASLTNTFQLGSCSTNTGISSKMMQCCAPFSLRSPRWYSGEFLPWRIPWSQVFVTPRVMNPCFFKIWLGFTSARDVPFVALIISGNVRQLVLSPIVLKKTLTLNLSSHVLSLLWCTFQFAHVGYSTLGVLCAPPSEA